VRWILFLVLAAASRAVRVLGLDVVRDPAGSALLSLGCLVVGGVLAGELARRARLPRITGYLVLGMAIGPYAIGLQTVDDSAVLRLFEELALGLIALTAGGEFRLQGLGSRLPALLWITVMQCVAVVAVVGGAMWAVFTAYPIVGHLDGGGMLAAAAVVGVIAAASSPATTIAVITETRARGVVVDTVLGVTILKDLVILLLYTFVEVLARALTEGSPVTLRLLHGTGLEILLSLVAGGVLGLLLGAYVQRVHRHLELVVVLVALASAELAHGAGLEHLIVCMAAGFVVRNLYPRAATGFLDALERSSPPIYVVFFGLVGAGLDLAVVLAVGAPALLYVGLRLAATAFLTRGGALLAGSPPQVVRYAWMGFVAQAGLSLGLAVRLAARLPGLGPPLATLVVAAVVINQLAGPVLWERALRASGEAGPTAATDPPRQREYRQSLLPPSRVSAGKVPLHPASSPEKLEPSAVTVPVKARLLSTENFTVQVMTPLPDEV
jgi:Kef-type K+ transport system membrane component KefB